MSDYSKTTNFSAKDSLPTGNSNKIIQGSLFDTEFDNIVTAVATKYDSGDLASQAQAEAETLNTVLMTPLRVANWADANGGMVGDIQALADPGNDTLLGWDDSASAVIGFTFTDGLAFGDGVVTLEHLGIEDLEDPGADRIMFWDDSESAMKWLAPGTNLSISTTTLSYDLASAIVDLDVSGLTSSLTINTMNPAQDGFLISDNGNLEILPYNSAGINVQAGETTQTLAAADANTVLEFDGTATVTIPTNASVAFPIGTVVILSVDHATQEVTVTAASGCNLRSIFHPAGADNASDVVLAGGTAALIKMGVNEWALSGDIKDS